MPWKTKTRGLYKPRSLEPFKVSRSGIELFLECSRCFYINHRHGIRRLSGPPFNLNSLVDKLLKKEFDLHRASKTSHPLMIAYGIDALPFHHPSLNDWRENFKGVQTIHEPTNLRITGAVDDLWINPKGEIIVVDYKATAKNGEVSIDAEWQMSYKRQMEIYQWLVRRQGLPVSNTGYFVYCNGRDAHHFNERIEFGVKVIPYTGSESWIDAALANLKACLDAVAPPPASSGCEFCGYAEERTKLDLGTVNVYPF